MKQFLQGSKSLRNKQRIVPLETAETNNCHVFNYSEKSWVTARSFTAGTCIRYDPKQQGSLVSLREQQGHLQGQPGTSCQRSNLNLWGREGRKEKKTQTTLSHNTALTCVHGAGLDLECHKNTMNLIWSILIVGEILLRIVHVYKQKEALTMIGSTMGCIDRYCNKTCNTFTCINQALLSFWRSKKSIYFPPWPNN